MLIKAIKILMVKMKLKTSMLMKGKKLKRNWLRTRQRIFCFPRFLNRQSFTRQWLQRFSTSEKQAHRVTRFYTLGGIGTKVSRCQRALTCTACKEWRVSNQKQETLRSNKKWHGDRDNTWFLTFSDSDSDFNYLRKGESALWFYSMGLDGLIWVKFYKIFFIGAFT